MREILIRLLLAAGVMLVAFALGSSTNAQQASQAKPQQADEDPSANNPRPGQTSEPQQNASPAQSSNEPQTQDALAFTGVVSREKGEVVLSDPVTKVVYKLDDPDKAQSYLGKRVKVIGKLAMNSNTIQISSIEAIPQPEHE